MSDRIERGQPWYIIRDGHGRALMNECPLFGVWRSGQRGAYKSRTLSYARHVASKYGGRVVKVKPSAMSVRAGAVRKMELLTAKRARLEAEVAVIETQILEAWRRWRTA